MTTRQAESAATLARVTSIARSTEAVSLELLCAIEDTVSGLIGAAKIASGLSMLLSGLIDDLASGSVSPGGYIDPKDATIDMMARTSAQLENCLAALTHKHAAVSGDDRLHDHHCEALHDAFETAIIEIAELAEYVEKARAALIAHDLRAEPRDSGEGFPTVAELIADLRGE
jgi:hypothetical protein